MIFWRQGPEKPYGRSRKRRKPEAVGGRPEGIGFSRSGATGRALLLYFDVYVNFGNALKIIDFLLKYSVFPEVDGS
jgi:hypothetical protein